MSSGHLLQAGDGRQHRAQRPAAAQRGGQHRRARQAVRLHPGGRGRGGRRTRHSPLREPAGIALLITSKLVIA